MSCNPESGMMRELDRPEDVKPGEVLFKYGELITIKGCLFKVQQICGDPHNTITLKSTGLNSNTLRGDHIGCKKLLEM